MPHTASNTLINKSFVSKSFVWQRELSTRYRNTNTTNFCWFTDNNRGRILKELYVSFARDYLKYRARHKHTGLLCTFNSFDPMSLLEVSENSGIKISFDSVILVKLSIVCNCKCNLHCYLHNYYNLSFTVYSVHNREQTDYFDRNLVISIEITEILSKSSLQWCNLTDPKLCTWGCLISVIRFYTQKSVSIDD